MSRYANLTDLAVEDTRLSSENRRRATGYVFEVYEALVQYLEPPGNDSIEVVYLVKDSESVVVEKSLLLESKLLSKDPKKYNQFSCGIKFHFQGQMYGAGCVAYLDIFVSEQKCRIFGETHKIADSESIGKCAYEYLSKRYDPNYSKPLIGFM